ncbi:hypothetical protein M9Y10_010845 [Tritrichomonas musculus]|uniref:KilA-N domain-containing protein n=1 Tax=Tritrichomonas musculus TaxID=1915356 RepID=A0ABR2IM23_9EUKA
MNNSKPSTKTITTASGETFTYGTYNGISVLVHDKDGFINATAMCNQFNKRFKELLENKSWNEYFDAFLKEFYDGPNSVQRENKPIYQLHSGLTLDENELRGTYVDPRLINYIAFWASPTYAISVGKIMDSINDKVHDVLEKNHLPDTVENSKPIFKEVAKRITLKIDVDLVNGQCWGVRDDVHRLDQNEQDDLRSDIDKYNSIKQQLNANPNDTTLKKQLNESKAKLESDWKWFIPTYYPEFQY